MLAVAVGRVDGRDGGDGGRRRGRCLLLTGGRLLLRGRLGGGRGGGRGGSRLGGAVARRPERREHVADRDDHADDHGQRDAAQHPAGRVDAPLGDGRRTLLGRERQVPARAVRRAVGGRGPRGPGGLGAERREDRRFPGIGDARAPAAGGTGLDGRGRRGVGRRGGLRGGCTRGTRGTRSCRAPPRRPAEHGGGAAHRLRGGARVVRGV
ncbi:hypothetical protein FA014_00005, partial [Cellulomonas hominis]